MRYMQDLPAGFLSFEHPQMRGNLAFIELACSYVAGNDTISPRILPLGKDNAVSTKIYWLGHLSCFA